MFVWAKTGGYEVSTKGDRRFSAFNAILEDGRSIEEWYQCDVKGYDKGGKNWRLGKGKPPINRDIDLFQEYLALWVRWARANPPMMEYLKNAAEQNNCVLSDRFATTPVNQACALATILNMMEKQPK